MFDVPVLFELEPLSCRTERRLRAPLAVAPGDETAFICLGHVHHLGRRRRCGWHLTLHRDPDGALWTHLYRVVPEHGEHVAVLLARACRGDVRPELAAWTRLRHGSPRLPSSGPSAGLRG